MGCVLSLVQPLYSGRVRLSYAQDRRVIRAGILTWGATDPSSPYAMYLLGSESVYVPLTAATGFEFYPPKPSGWEIINPIATPTAGDKIDPAYWRVPKLGEGTLDLPLAQNFDLLLLPITDDLVTWMSPTTNPLNHDAVLRLMRVLERWVDQGGLLWIDNQRSSATPLDGKKESGHGDFFLRPPLWFGPRLNDVAARKISVDVTHPLLQGRYPLSQDEVQLLGRQYAYGAVGDPTNAGLSPLDSIGDLMANQPGGVNNPFPPNNVITSVTALQEVVGELDPGSRNRFPVIAAGHLGDGCIVVTACGVASAIGDWFAGLSSRQAQTVLELPQWSLPDIKLVYNMIEWWMDWPAAHGRVRFRGDYREDIAGPPAVAWDDLMRDPVSHATGALGGPAVTDRGLVFAGSLSGTLSAWDAEPGRDRSFALTDAAIGPPIVGQGDDGWPDYAAGSGRDLLWSAIVPWQDPNDVSETPRSPADPPRAVIGSPAVVTTYTPTPTNAVAAPHPVVAVAVRTLDNLDSSLQAFDADPLDAPIPLLRTPPPWPPPPPGLLPDGKTANPLWSATIKRFDEPAPERGSGMVNSGPTGVGQFFALVTTDSGTLDSPNRDAHLLIFDANGPNPAEPPGQHENPAVNVEIAEGGRAASFANPPASALTGAWDEPQGQWWGPVQIAVMVGNSLPRPGPSATGRLWCTPLMVRFPAPGWDRTWIKDPSDPRGTEVADNQSVTVTIGGQVVPPHVDDDPNQALNYIRSSVSGQMRIIFCRWSLFGHGWFPLGYDSVQIAYRDTTGQTRQILQGLHPGFPVSLGGYVNEDYHLATPCVHEDDIFVVTDAVNAYPSPSSEGQVAAYSVGLEQASGPNWTFVGERYRGQAPTGLNGTYFSSFSFTPAYGQDTLFAVGNYQFFHDEQTQTNDIPAGIPAGALYALDLKATRELMVYDPSNPGRSSNPILPSLVDLSAPRNDGGIIVESPYGAVRDGTKGVVTIITTQPHWLQAGDTVQISGVVSVGPSNFNGSFDVTDVPGSTTFTYAQAGANDQGGGGTVTHNQPPFSADPNQVVLPGRAGPAVWITSNIDPSSSDYNSPRYAIPQMAGSTVNWRVDFPNNIIRLGSGMFGRLACPVWSDMGTAGDTSDDRYVPQRVRVRYFSGGQLQEVVMEVAPLTKWFYLAPDGWEFVSPPVVSNDMIMVAAYHSQTQRELLLGFRAVPQNAAPTDPLWAHPALPQWVQLLAANVAAAQPCNLAVADRGIIWSGNLTDAAGATAGAVARLGSPETIIGDNHRLVAVNDAAEVVGTQEALAHPAPQVTLGAAYIPIVDSYADRAFEPLAPPRRARLLPNDNLLVVDSGANCVLELDPTGEVVWRYPNDDPRVGLGEPYTDSNSNGQWDTGEPFTDVNGNGVYDPGTDDLGGMTPQQAQLYSPADAHRYTYRFQSEGSNFVDPSGIIQASDVVTVDWESTLIADTGNRRVIEVARPLLDGRYRPEVTDQATGARYAELVRVVAGPATTWHTAAGGTTSVPAAFVTAERFWPVDGSARTPFDQVRPYLSTDVICGVGNAPADPMVKDSYVRLVEIAVTYGASVQPTSAVIARAGEGINVFRPRVSPWSAANAEQVERDFLGIRQADQIVVPDADTGARYQTVIVDDVGVKVIDNATWNSTLQPAFEMRGAAPWLDKHKDAERAKLPGDFMTTYEEEIAGGTIASQDAATATRILNQSVLGVAQALDYWVSTFGNPTSTHVYPPLIDEPLRAPDENLSSARAQDFLNRWEALRGAAWSNLWAYAHAVAASGKASGEVPFLPSFAKRERNGKYLIVNSYPVPYTSQGPLDVMAPTTSEVLEVDPTQPVGQRVVKSWDEHLNAWNRYAWNHFIVPDPARSEYPGARGGASSFAVPNASPPPDYLVVPGGASSLHQPWAVDRR